MKQYAYLMILMAVLCFETQAQLPLSASLSAKETTRVEKLRGKYLWGSIYITHLSFINLKSILRDQNKVAGLTKVHPSGALLKLSSFIEQQIDGAVQYNAAAFVEIDLNRMEAGYKSEADAEGVIHKLPWDAGEVLNVAEFCDIQLNRIGTYRRVLADITTTPIWRVFQAVDSFKNDPYLSTEAYYVAAKELRLQIALQSNEPSNIMSSQQKNQLNAFAQGYDKIFETQGSFGITGLQKFSPEFQANFMMLDMLLQKRKPAWEIANEPKDRELKFKDFYQEQNQQKPKENK